MPKKLEKIDYRYHEKLAKIRKGNVERHAGFENTKKLRANILRHRQNATYDMEHDKLKHASAQGHLAAHAHKRLADLVKILGK